MPQILSHKKATQVGETIQSGSKGEEKLTSLRNMFTTSSNGTSFRNCMASSNSSDRSAGSPSCGPRNVPMRVAPPLSERRGTANRVSQPIKDFKAGLCTKHEPIKLFSFSRATYPRNVPFSTTGNPWYSHVSANLSVLRFVSGQTRCLQATERNAILT